MSDIVIRKMAQRDLEDVLTIEKDTFSDPWSYNSFKSDLYNEMARPLVATLDEKLIGYACIYIVAGEIQIGNIAVAPAHRRRGVARLLMKEILLIAEDKDCRSIFLEVRESNMAAQTLYNSLGFKAVAKRDAYYQNPRENAIIMVKEY